MFKRRRSKSYLLKYRGTTCLNCGHDLDRSDRYCPKCSQINSTKRITFVDLFREFFDTIFSYDSKFRKTLSIIVRHPGKITLEYIGGKRTTYTNPFRFFLSLLFFYVILLSFSYDSTLLDETMRNNLSGANFNIIPANKIPDTINTDSLTKNKFKVSADGIEYKKKQDTIEEAKDSLHYYHAKIYFKDSVPATSGSYIESVYLKGMVFNYGISKKDILSYEHLLSEMKVEDTWQNRIAYRFGFNLYKVKNNISLYLSYLINKIPFVIFFLIPFLTFFIWLIYSKQKFYYMDHMVFCYQTLTMLVFSYLVVRIIDLITQSTALSSLALVIIIPYNFVYLYKAMRRFYGQSRGKTFLKYLYINTIFSILAIITFIIFAAVSFLLF